MVNGINLRVKNGNSLSWFHINDNIYIYIYLKISFILNYKCSLEYKCMRCDIIDPNDQKIDV